MLLFCAAAALWLPTLFSTLSHAQLSGPVGPITSAASKAAVKTCNVLDYGAKADKATDIGPSLLAAFKDCKAGGLVLIPSGDYSISTWTSLSGGSKWALQLDGVIYRDESTTAGGNMIFIQHTTDFEMFSSNRLGAVQGNGYAYHQNDDLTGPRLLRFYDVNDFSIHDIKLVDAPAFHFTIDHGSNGEVYNVLVRGGDHGGLDGIDIFSTNVWVHDVMVTNKDECVTVKSPSTNILIESIHCNHSGGCAIGSLGTDTAISNVVYRNIYTVVSNQMMMVKSNGGSGYVENVLMEGFIGRSNAYSLDVDQYWSSMKTIEGVGVSLRNFTFTNWHGTCASGTQRGPIRLICADTAPCISLTLSNFSMWTDSGSTLINSCRSAYGTGSCLHPDTDTGSELAYAETKTTVTVKPTDYAAPTMEGDLTDGAWGYTISIPLPSSWPGSYYPGVMPLSLGPV